MRYSEALEYIHSVSWKGSIPGLSRTEQLLKKIGDPQNSLRFVHVAGTNGKGSFCSMLSCVLKEAGYRVGLYTSPFVERFNERMRVDGVDISDRELAEITEYIRPFADSMSDVPTEFELITAIAFEYFARHDCDIVVLECGMGGRLDSTNIINTAVLSVITGIALDHTAFLGDTVEKIAYEKAGIIKRGVPCLWCGDTADVGGRARAVIAEKAECEGSALYVADHSGIKIISTDTDGTVFDYGDMKNIKIRLLGNYQPYNASNVIEAAKILSLCGLSIEDSHIRKGLEGAKWAARFEMISDDPPFIFDGGHNPQGVDSAVDSVRLYFGDQRINVITGVLSDKDYGYISNRISSVARRVFCMTPDNPRALSAKEYAALFVANGVDALVCDSIEQAVESAVCDARAAGVGVICLGSLYVYADVKKALDNISEK